MTPVATLPPAPAPTAQHAAAVPAATATTTTYTVKYGDTLWVIAQRYKTSVSYLVSLNRLSDGGSRLYVGQRLLVPSGTTVTPPTTPTTPTTLGPSTTYTVSVSRLNVRSGPSTSHGIVGYLTAGQRVTGRLDSRTGWVSLGNGRWAISTWLKAGTTTTTPTTPTTPSTLGPTRTYAVVNTSYLNVRSGPSTRYGIVGSLSGGQKVSGRLDSRTGWVNLGTGRWASGDYLRATTGTTTPTTPTTGIPDPATQSVAANLAWLRSHAAPTRAELRSMIIATARRYGVDPNLALAISMVESGQDQRQVSYCNAIGAMQVMPSTGTWISGLTGQRLNLLRAQDNVTAGVYLLKILTSQARNRDEAIAGYYQGLYGVQHNGMLPDTKVYVARVKSWIGRA